MIDENNENEPLSSEVPKPEAETPKPKVVVHETGVRMGREAYETGRPPEGAVSSAAFAKPGDEEK